MYSVVVNNNLFVDLFANVNLKIRASRTKTAKVDA